MWDVFVTTMDNLTNKKISLFIAILLLALVYALGIITNLHSLISFDLNDSTVVGLILTIIALLLSCYQTWAGSLHTQKLTTISNALSTRYLGQFPGFFSEVEKVTSNAKDNLLILNSIPLPLVFTDENAWFGLKQSIERSLKLKNIKVSCVFSDKTNQDLFSRKQHDRAVSDWTAWRSEPHNIQKIKSFFDRCDGAGDVNNLTSDGFFHLFEHAAAEAIRTTYKGAVVYEIPFRPPLYSWVADGKEAVFIISSTSPSFRAEAFWTTDSDLIGALVRMHHECRDQGQPVQDTRIRSTSTEFKNIGDGGQVYRIQK